MTKDVTVDRAALLLSFYFWKDADLDRVFAGFPADKHPVVFADSGGFSADVAGAVIDIDDYSAWLKRWAHHITMACTLDVVGNAPATLANTVHLEASGVTVLPVFHVGEPWSALEEWVNAYPFMCIGGMVPWGRQRRKIMAWILECFRYTEQTGTVLHGLGQTQWRNICDLPFYSADSSSWTSAERFGTVQLWDPQADRSVSFVTGKDPHRCHRYGDLLRSYGLDPVAFSTARYCRTDKDAGKAVELARVERRLVRRANVSSWRLQTEWWRRRFGPIHAPNMPDGPHLFIVVLYQEQVDDVGIVVHGDAYVPQLNFQGVST